MAEGRFSKLEKKLEEGAPGTEQAPSGVTPLGAPTTQLADDPNLYPSFILQADEAYFTGNYREALRHYSRALQQESNHVYPWIGQISSLIALKQFREAELWSNRALEQFPEDSSLLSQRARVLALTGNYKRALGVSDYALGKGATAWSWLARGEVLLEAGDNNAGFCYEKAVEAAGREDWRVPLIAGLTYMRRRQWANAEDYLRRAAAANPRNYFIWYEYAVVLRELSFFDRSKDAAQRALQLKPGFRPANDLNRDVLHTPFLKRILGMFKR